MLLRPLVVHFLLLVTSVAVALFQSYGVRGRLLCGSTWAGAVRVRLCERDGRLHELLEEDVTDADGNFSLAGGTAEFTTIEPILEVLHNCGDAGKVGLRRARFGLPQFYITNGQKALKTFDVAILNLETHFLGEDREFSETDAH